jgi:hypothetical protein
MQQNVRRKPDLLDHLISAVRALATDTRLTANHEQKGIG